MRRPLHPPLVHFPVALLATSLGFDLVGLVRADGSWWALGFWNAALGVAFGVLAAFAGLIDSARVTADSPASPMLTRHILVMIAALSCYGAALVVRAGPGAPAGSALAATIALEAVGLGLLLLGGFLGGELVFRFAIGRSDAAPPRSAGAAPQSDAAPPRSAGAAQQRDG